MRITLLGLVLIGCGGSGGGTSFEGIWRVDTWTLNNAGCDVEGPSVTVLHEPFFFTKNESLFGTSFVNVNNCDDIATCAAMANDNDTLHIGLFGFESGSDSAGWSTHSALGFNFQDMCTGGVTDATLAINASTFRIEARHFEAVPFPPLSGDDECPDDKVEQAAAGQPCQDFEVVTATYMQDY